MENLTLYSTGYSGDKTAELARTTLRPKPGKIAIFDAMVERLDLLVVDIRFTPWSQAQCWREPEMRKKWGDATRDTSARYIHVGELGNRNYRNHRNGGQITLDHPVAGVRRVLDAAEKAGKAPLLLCACPDAIGCHRLTVGKLFDGHFADWLEILDWTNPADCGSKIARVYSESLAFDHWPSVKAEIEAALKEAA